MSVSIHNCRQSVCPAATLPPLRRFASLAVGRVLVLLGCLALSVPAHAQKVSPIRPPAVPLIVRTPYVSTWQPSTDLAGTWPSFWDGGTKAITGIARIDGHPYLFLGNPQIPNLTLPVMTQSSLTLTPTQSRYEMRAAGVNLSIDFLSPVEPVDLRRLSIPLGYIFAHARSVDGRRHRVSLYFDITAEWAHGDNKTLVIWDREQIGRIQQPITAFSVTPANPTTLAESHQYPSWGQAVWATFTTRNLTTQVGPDTAVRAAAAERGALDGSIDRDMPRAIDDRWPVFGFNFDLGQVGSATSAPISLVLGHVQDPAVSYLTRPIPPLWRSYWPDWEQMVAFTLEDGPTELSRADQIDARVTKDATRAGGAHYAALCALALRQAFGATEMVGTTEKPWMFMKEISSDGNISTVDVVYPAFPVFLYANPYLLRLQLDPLFAYAETGGWPKKFAEHDIGSSYPNAAGHNDGREEDMPVEESANMLIMAAAYMKYAPRADAADYASAHYKILKQWADYEVENGLDPALQNQTDDFTGFIKSSANLALKAIIGVGAMGQIAEYAGNRAEAAQYRNVSRDMISKWARLAQSKTGPHLVLAYGQDDTWSLKYNAFPDKVLGLNLVPQSVLKEEAHYYLAHLNPFGVPLDNRHTYTKTDWELWTAASTDDRPLRQAFVDAIYKFANTSKFRGAFTDWYDTVSGQQRGFVARPVIGGVFAILDRTALHRAQ